MTMMIGDKTVGLWSVAIGDRGNWLAHLTHNDDGGLTMMYRFRWYRDDKTYNSKDEKNWYQADSKSMTEAQGIDVMRGVYHQILGASARNKGWELLRGARDMDDFMTELFKMPGMHHKTFDASGNEIPDEETK